jgi:hypothetical protein
LNQVGKETLKLLGHAWDLETIVNWISCGKDPAAFHAFSPAFGDKCAIKGPQALPQTLNHPLPRGILRNQMKERKLHLQ